MSEAELRAHVDKIIELLELRSVADTMVGSPDSGLNVGERKRYTIGVELVANPSVLFLGQCSTLPFAALTCHQNPV